MFLKSRFTYNIFYGNKSQFSLSLKCSWSADWNTLQGPGPDKIDLKEDSDQTELQLPWSLSSWNMKKRASKISSGAELRQRTVAGGGAPDEAMVTMELNGWGRLYPRLLQKERETGLNSLTQKAGEFFRHWAESVEKYWGTLGGGWSVWLGHLCW